MSKKQIYPSPSRTRTVYPPLAIFTRQTLIEPNVIKWRYRDWEAPITSPGNYSYVVDNLRTEYIYVYISSILSTTTVVLSNPVLGRVEINVTSGRYINVFRSGGQPINIEIITNGYPLVYLCEAIPVTGETEVIRVRPRACRELVVIHGDDVIASCTQGVYFEFEALTGSVEYYVNGVYYGRGNFYRGFTLDREIVVTARGNGFIRMRYMIYPERITLDVDTAYVVPCPGYCIVYENNRNYFDTPCIYRNPTISIDPWYSERDFVQTLVLEINDQLKRYIDVNRIRNEVCGI